MSKLVVSTSLRVRDVSKHAAMAAIGTAALALFSTNAGAASSVGVATTKRVDFADLDLAKPADAKRLYRRLQSAARDVCGDYAGADRVLPTSARDRCEQAAVTNAVETVGHPNVTALHAAKTHVRLAQGKAQRASSG